MNIIIDSNTFEGNTAISGGAIAFYTVSSLVIDLTDNIYYSNAADSSNVINIFSNLKTEELFL
jgi:predicted outer membrane repeat protein